MCIGGGSAARPCACIRKASATASTYSSNGTRAVRSSRDRTIKGGAVTTEAVVWSTRNHLDERALRRAWTENRLEGACVSQSPKSIPASAAQQEPGAMRARFMPRISHPPEWSCGFTHRLDSRETDVREQVLLIGQLEERVALGAALGPALKEPPWSS